MNTLDLLDFCSDLMKLLIRPGIELWSLKDQARVALRVALVALCAVWEKLDYAEESADTVWMQAGYFNSY